MINKMKKYDNNIKKVFELLSLNNDYKIIGSAKNNLFFSDYDMNSLLNYTKQFNKTIKDDIIWPTLKTKILKYGPFLTYNKERMKLILRNMIK